MDSRIVHTDYREVLTSLQLQGHRWASGHHRGDTLSIGCGELVDYLLTLEDSIAKLRDEHRLGLQAKDLEIEMRNAVIKELVGALRRNGEVKGNLCRLTARPDESLKDLMKRAKCLYRKA